MIRHLGAMAVLLAGVGAAHAAGSGLQFIQGACTATLNGTDVGCDGKAVLSALPNGRKIAQFVATDIATMGFAGSRLQEVKGDTILWLDGAYVNERRQAADGQCDIGFAVNGGAPTSLNCHAVLADGRKLAAKIQSASATSSVDQPPAAAQCPAFIHMHAFLTRAQFQCHFDKYRQSVIDNASACAHLIGEDASKAQLMSGFAAFDAQEKSMGHSAACRAVIQKFGDIVNR